MIALPLSKFDVSVFFFNFWRRWWILCSVKPSLRATSVTRSPPYYGQLFLASWQNGHTFSWKKTSLIRSPVNTAKVFGPLVTALTGFHCKKRLEHLRCWLVLHYKEKYVVQRLRETWKSFVEQRRKRDHFIGEISTHSDYGVRFIGRVQKRICDFRWILNYQNTEGPKKDLLPWKRHVHILLVMKRKKRNNNHLILPAKRKRKSNIKYLQTFLGGSEEN